MESLRHFDVTEWRARARSLADKLHCDFQIWDRHFIHKSVVVSAGGAVDEKTRVGSVDRGGPNTSCRKSCSFTVDLRALATCGCL